MIIGNTINIVRHFWVCGWGVPVFPILDDVFYVRINTLNIIFSTVSGHSFFSTVNVIYVCKLCR